MFFKMTDNIDQNDSQIQQKFNDIINRFKEHQNRKQLILNVHNLLMEIDHPDQMDYQVMAMACIFCAGTDERRAWVANAIESLRQDYTKRLPKCEKLSLPHFGSNY